MKKVLIVYFAGCLLLFLAPAQSVLADGDGDLSQAEGPYKAEQVSRKVTADESAEPNDAAYQADRILTLTRGHVAADRLPEAQEAVQGLLVRFGDDSRLSNDLEALVESAKEIDKTPQMGQVYVDLLEAQPTHPQAVWLKMGVAVANVYLSNDQAVDAALRNIIAQHGSDERSTEAFNRTAKAYRKLARYDKALQVYQHVVDTWPTRERAIYSQRGVVLCHLALGDDAAATAALQKLLTDYSSNKYMPEIVRSIAMTYSRRGESDQARQLQQYIADKRAQLPDAAWAQLAILDSEGRAEDDPAVVTALDDLLIAFAQQKTPAMEIYRLAEDCSRMHADRAFKLHQFNSLNSPKDDQHTMWSKAEVVKYHIRDGNEPAAEQAVNEMIDRFAKQKTLSIELARIGDAFTQAEQYDKADQLYGYILQHWSDAEDTLWAKAGQVGLCIARGDDNAAETLFRKVMADFANDTNLPQAVKLIAEACQARATILENEHICQLDNPDEYALRLTMQGRPEAVKWYYRRAIEKWQTIIAQLPETADVTPEAYIFAGVCCEKVGDHGKSLEYFYAAAERYPTHEYAPFAEFMIGKVVDQLQRDGRLTREEATSMRLQAARTLLDRYPQSEYAWSARKTFERIIETQIPTKERVERFVEIQTRLKEQRNEK